MHPTFFIRFFATKMIIIPIYQQAQKWYEQRKKSGQTGWKSLDRDGDGQACDCLPGGNSKKCPKRR